MYLTLKYAGGLNWQKKLQSEQVVQKYNQTDGRRRKKKLKSEHFRFPQLRSCLLWKVILAAQCFAVPRAQLLPSTHYNRV